MKPVVEGFADRSPGARMGGLGEYWKRSKDFGQAEVRYLHGLYLGGVSYTDHELAILLEALDERDLLDETIVVVLSDANFDQASRLIAEGSYQKVTSICLGGKRRQDSVRRGLDRLPDAEWIVVHDAARPLIDAGLIERGLVEALLTGVAVAAVPVKDTIKAANADMVVTQTLGRETLWIVQTPQVFRSDILSEAHEMVNDDVTDDASMVERAGGKVRLFMGYYENIKVTTPEDLPVAEALLTRRARLVSQGRA